VKKRKKLKLLTAVVEVTEKNFKKRDIPGHELFDFIPYPMVISSLEGEVVYLNDAFNGVFGWTPDDLKSHRVPSIPVDLQKKITESLKEFPGIKVFRIETKWPTREKAVLDVDIMGRFLEYKHGFQNVAIIIRDIKRQIKSKLINETLLRISTALPSYPVLEDLMDYISTEISGLLNTEGAVVMLLDEKSNEIFFQGVGLDDSDTRKKVKKIRIPADKSITGRVIRTGDHLIINDTAEDADYYTGVDEQMNNQTRNMLVVPLRTSDRIIGVLNAVNKKEGRFDDTDLELMKMIAGTVALSIENARVSSQLTDAYNEVASLNRAKDRVINHLSHELKTPVSVLLGSINIISRRFGSLPETGLSPTLQRARRNLERILELQYELKDIMNDKEYRAYGMLSTLLDECADELESLVAEEIGKDSVTQRIRNRIEEIFGPDKSPVIGNDIPGMLTETLNILRPRFLHRSVELVEHIENTQPVSIPREALKKIITGLIKNALENTPDQGKIEVSVVDKQDEARFILRDYGVGITEDDQKRIFEGFHPTQETMQYSSKRPFDFNAGGKGADLLRIRIFSERYGFKIHMESSRCGFILQKGHTCPGRITHCVFCRSKEDCYNSGGTTFTIVFPYSS
jgi:PAS domain S-box-containing protein